MTATTVSLQREGSTLKLVIDYHVPYGSDWNSTFTHSLGSEHHAQTTYAILKDAIEKKIEEARREAYEQGWKDKSAKKSKKTWFSCQL